MGAFIYKQNDISSGINQSTIKLIEKKTSIIDIDDVGYAYIKPVNIQNKPDSIQHLELSDNYFGIFDNSATPIVTISNEGIRLYNNRGIAIDGIPCTTTNDLIPITNITSRFSYSSGSLSTLDTSVNNLTLSSANSIAIGTSIVTMQASTVNVNASTNVTLSSGTSTIMMQQNNININCSNNINIYASTNMTLSVGTSKIIMLPSIININCTNNMNINASQRINMTATNINMKAGTCMRVNAGYIDVRSNGGTSVVYQNDGTLSLYASNNINARAAVPANSSYNDLWSVIQMNANTGTLNIGSHWLVSYNNSSNTHPAGSDTYISFSNEALKISIAHVGFGSQSINLGGGSIKFTCNSASMVFNASGLYINNNKVSTS